MIIYLNNSTSIIGGGIEYEIIRAKGLKFREE